jgi:hypothetical protein
VAPIPAMMSMMPPMASTSLGDQVLDLSVRKPGKQPSEKKVKPIKRLSKKALQSVFHPFVDPELLRMAAPMMVPPATAPLVLPQENAKKSRKSRNNMPPPLVAPFIFQIEDHHVRVAPDGSKVIILCLK